jgi:hypothetical protein
MDHENPFGRLEHRWAILVGMACMTAVTIETSAWAYRPFDGTDADVAGVGDFELELGPVHWLSQGNAHYAVAPATVLNLGILPGSELVVDVQNLVGIDVPPGQAKDRVVDTDVLAKAVILSGALQGVGSRPSIAAEAGPLLPDVNGESGFGVSVDVIVSERWPALAVHVNSWLELSRGSLRPDWFEGAIIEGSEFSRVRPVGEWFVEHDFAADVTTVSGLVGGIWRARAGLDVDMGLREALAGGQRVSEVRVGLTWTFALWRPGSPASDL